MRPLRAWTVYLVVVLVGGALLAPWLYGGTQWAAQRLGGLQELAEEPFHRYVDRSLLGLALIGLWPLLRRVGIHSWLEVGSTTPAGQWERLGLGFALGFGSLAVVAGLAVAMHARQWTVENTAAEVAHKVLSAGLTAGVVSVLEETLFRGALFGSLRRAHGWRVGLVASSLVYALTHFFAQTRWEGPVEWWTGLVVLGRMCRGFVELSALLPAFLTLALAGGILAAVYERTGTLWCSIGLHAGWIFWLKLYGFMTVAAPGASSGPWGTARLVDGWLVLATLGVLVVALVRFLPGLIEGPRSDAGITGGSVS